MLGVVPDFMSRWLYVPHVMAGLSRHWSSGQPLPDSMLDGLLATKQHMAGYNLSRELFLAAYDIAFYSEDYETETFQALADRLAEQYMGGFFLNIWLNFKHHLVYSRHRCSTRTGRTRSRCISRRR